jgi:hypothetical protein
MRAVADYSEAIRLKPSNPGAYVWCGRAYRAMGEAERAEADFAMAKQLKELYKNKGERLRLWTPAPSPSGDPPSARKSKTGRRCSANILAVRTVLHTEAARSISSSCSLCPSWTIIPRPWHKNSS